MIFILPEKYKISCFSSNSHTLNTKCFLSINFREIKMRAYGNHSGIKCPSKVCLLWAGSLGYPLSHYHLPSEASSLCVARPWSSPLLFIFPAVMFIITAHIILLF
jgi:hypothetical protein